LNNIKSDINTEDKTTSIFIKYNKQIPKEYISDIWYTLKDQQKFDSQNYVQNQPELNEKMRGILIDWLIDVHNKFKLETETLYLTVSIIDRYISKKVIQRNKFQLLGITALFIASKFEEIFFPDLDNYVYVTDNTYLKKEILAMERDIMNVLQFEISFPSSLRFFEIIALNYNFNELEFMYGKYLLELFLIHPKVYKPSIIAISACYIIMKINSYTNYPELYTLLSGEESTKQVKECAKEIYDYVLKVDTLQFKAVFNKYSKDRYFKISLLGMNK
jgi:hypothetical protein